MSEVIFVVGIGLMIAAALGAVASVIAFTVSGKRLHRQLEREYGKKRH